MRFPRILHWRHDKKIADANTINDLNNFAVNKVLTWFKNKGWEAQNFQKECWKAYSEGKNGILHAQLEVEKPMQYGEVLSKNH